VQFLFQWIKPRLGENQESPPTVGANLPLEEQAEDEKQEGPDDVPLST
jgi:hypothetical protein